MTIRQLLSRMKRIGGDQTAETAKPITEAGPRITGPQIKTLARPERASCANDVRLWHEGVARRLGRNDFYLVCEPECDGFAVSLTYRNGNLTCAVATNGDDRGQAVTDTLRKVPGVPRRLTGTDLPIHLEVMANLYVPLPSGANQAGGSRSALRLIVHGISSSSGGRVPSNQWSAFAYLRAVGFDVSSDIKLARTPQELLSHYQTLAARAKAADYPCTGMLVQVNRFDHQSLLSAEEGNANWALSYGFPRAPETESREAGKTTARPQQARHQPLKGLSVAVEVRSGRPSVLQVENRVRDLGGTIVRDVKCRANFIITDSPEKSMLKARLMRARTVGLGDFIRYCNSLKSINSLDDLIARI